MSDFTFEKIHTAYSAQVYWMLSLCKISPVKIQCNYFCEYAVSIFKKICVYYKNKHSQCC